ncbi:MAG: hypothetical protein IJX36_04640 [Thermoguttaceae bacterium]|nr:hypothetical protein [Thermoguttaceae bacterium]
MTPRSRSGSSVDDARRRVRLPAPTDARRSPEPLCRPCALADLPPIAYFNVQCPISTFAASC